MKERAISDYVLIGDTRTAALVSSDGSIDWMCVPTFDGEALFGRLLGGDVGGSFAISVQDTRESNRHYKRHSAIVETDVAAQTGTGRLIDGMVVEVAGALLPQLILVRRVECDKGHLRLRILFDPKLGLPGRPPRAAKRAGVLVCEWGSIAIGLHSSPDLDLAPGKELTFELAQGATLTMVMTLSNRSPVVFTSPGRATQLLEKTNDWWHRWVAETNYEGSFADAVLRSLITLQMLTFAPSGAPVAAPTTSLPEEIGGSRNWDYRFSWPRDASIGLAAFLALGKADLAHSYMHWLLHASRLTRPRLEVLYTLYGKRCPKEREVGGIPGYLASRPVRIGNAAATQHQLDVYGWVLDAGWLLTKAGRTLQAETWRALSGFADIVVQKWREPDAGIWEVRTDPQHYLHSKLMAWLCLDRALRMSSSHRTRDGRRATWRRERDLLAADIRRHGFDDKRGSYVRAYGSSEQDAALLILPVLEFEEDAGRLEGTIAAIRRELEVGHGLVYRYPPGSDGLKGKEGAFLPCSFWLVQALAKSGNRDGALSLFERLLTLANDVGLLPEEIDPESGAHLGNFPQALTHATLIQAAMSLERD